MRIKTMSQNEFDQILQLDWTPVELVGDARPDFIKQIPKEIVHAVLASGTEIGVAGYASPRIPSGILVGGIDVYRYAPDDPVELNKDWYAVVIDPNKNDRLLVDGPKKDPEHWINEIPSRLKGVKVIGAPKIR